MQRDRDNQVLYAGMRIASFFYRPQRRPKQGHLCISSLLSMGRGSLDFAKQLVADDIPEEPTPPTDPPWCQCQVCVPMDTEQENVCCKNCQCISSYRTFDNICLDRDILEMCLKKWCDIRADESNFSMETFHKAAYCQFALRDTGTSTLHAFCNFKHISHRKHVDIYHGIALFLGDFSKAITVQTRMCEKSMTEKHSFQTLQRLDKSSTKTQKSARFYQ